MTKAQGDMIQRAMNGEVPGRFSRWCGVPQRSFAAMIVEGLVEQSYFVRDPQKRAEAERLRDAAIESARRVIADDWGMAFIRLSQAHELQQTLDDLWYWVTEKGRAAVSTEMAK